MKRDRQQQEILGEAVRNAFLKLDPRIQWKNPVMFIVFLGAILVAVLAVRAFMAGNTQEGWFDLHIDLYKRQVCVKPANLCRQRKSKLMAVLKSSVPKLSARVI